ncbi:membrane-bound lysozyme inhibitor of c-type lysozyme MliC [Nicoletella semolina]|uniref:Membrane-bound lysozyme inhibitor of c-type lysozyme MliC n=1 Tax=Nicoletella semolina TaxID=271160 RepID=A0A4R2N4U3_9PAST|nr:MliC family protein [Nicoletella semolina]MDH2924572.1 hypothetical protein [Nicoletella semolina]TCP15795.1 membrane-bound lysozyme inhibitor of c-type lysozyme MliC [Nicoletella semolina]
MAYLSLPLLISTTVMLCSCVAFVSPAEQLVLQESLTPHQAHRVVEHDHKVEKYHCQNNKVIQIQRTKAGTGNTITLTFNQRTHTLSRSVSKTGKQYSNIRWFWREEQNNEGSLRNNRNQFLAKNCIKKETGK